MIKEISEKYGNIINEYRKSDPPSEEAEMNYDIIQLDIQNYFEKELYPIYKFCKVICNQTKELRKIDYYFLLPQFIFTNNKNFLISDIDKYNDYRTPGLMITEWLDGTNVNEKAPHICQCAIDFDCDNTNIVEPISKEEFLDKWNNYAFYWPDKYEENKQDIEYAISLIDKADDIWKQTIKDLDKLDFLNF